MKNTRNCRDTFEEALAPFGLGRADIVENVNFFMYVPVDADGHMAIADGISKAGDYVDLAAETDVIACSPTAPNAITRATATIPRRSGSSPTLPVLSSAVTSVSSEQRHAARNAGIPDVAWLHPGYDEVS